MVILSRPVLDDNLVNSDFKTCTPASRVFAEIPVVDLCSPNAKAQIVQACKEYGFFKATNHGVSVEFLAQLESEALDFFNKPHVKTEASGPPNPCSYDIKKIGPNGDIGWVEFLLFKANPKVISAAKIPGVSKTLLDLVNENVFKVTNMTCGVLEMVAEELGIEPVDRLSQMLREDTSDSYFRLNHYPACSRVVELSNHDVVGFGEHTDPQIMSVIRSNSAPGLEICLKNGAWVAVPTDPTAFFFIVGDSLQVMTNGKFMSVRHRVRANSEESRLSMVFFGGPTPDEKIAPLSSVMEEGESSMYNEFTWLNYKESAYKTKLGDDRVSKFQKYKKPDSIDPID